MSRIALVVLLGCNAAFAASSQPQQTQTLNIGLWRIDKPFGGDTIPAWAASSR